MKIIAALMLLMSVSSFASTCFEREPYVQFQIIKDVPKTLCLEGFDAELNVFGDSVGVVYYDADGVSAARDSKLSGTKVPGGYRVKFKIYTKDTGFSCWEYERVEVTGTALISNSGKLIRFESVTGESDFRNDGCHDGPDTFKFKYNKQ